MQSGAARPDSLNDSVPTNITAKALQLGANKHSRGTPFSSAFAMDLERAMGAEIQSAWGSDLMDVNADADDWSK